jgi:hypothetical protein
LYHREFFPCAHARRVHRRSRRTRSTSGCRR